MSLEAILEEERREVLALLEATRATPRQRSRGSSASAASGQALPPRANPRSPVKSMLDIEDDWSPWHSPMRGINGGITSSRPSAPIRSMLDVSGSQPAAVASIRSRQASPMSANHRAAIAPNTQHRSLSDAASRPAANFGPRARGLNPASAYQFSGFLLNNPGDPVVPKPNTQAGKKKISPKAMAEAMRGELSSFVARDREKRHSIAGTEISSTANSKSPQNRLVRRSSSPLSRMLNSDSSRFVLNDGRVIDMTSAYQRLSDAKLALSAGDLSSLPEKTRRRRTDSANAIGLQGARLEQDHTPPEGEDAMVDSSDGEDRSSDDERQRGRRKEGRDTDVDAADAESKTVGTDQAKDLRSALILTTTPETDHQGLPAQRIEKYKVRSLLEPEITITGPPGDKLKSSKPGVHPITSFDEGASDLNTLVDSDAEADLTDIKRAQKLSVNMTSIVSTPATSRSVRTIYRGDFAKMQQEARDNQRRVRKYLVATDLSDEAAHALEWTVGTVLRDGDTLLAIYCVDEELGIVPNEASGDDSQLKEQAAAIAASARPLNTTPVLAPALTSTPSCAGFRLESHSTSTSPQGRERDKAEQERHRAVQDITDRVSRLLRKTKLQVKVVIEVIHCKSPKHLITEVIDYISPTLVILGSRGRSALKGVILGSFSNYLVTKSSVPVMVARKRLRKHSKYKRPSIRLANNLENPAVRSLASAKID
ncbi:hypothetical protein M430DRAFT_105858 [Amorphotheca resinae ATCC 22711]|uniref:UspA domain-containing protein n=1 Tax=Amorphotheca resinae ATCC 22711 TaxID=857342 RepID=A0A2T3AWL0_AMORE|nr:hypothetical protein M430DRAFT_105858 [Amorphotheca resinae ATCC 22711]PSS13062.1 hypothetical protein M430DRAFT_105858 [Amorphotheca resinae ATCC 22711]